MPSEQAANEKDATMQTKTTKHRDDDVIEVERLTSLTLIHSAEVLSKSYRLNEAGELEKYGQGGLLRLGTAQTISVRDLHELAELLPTLDAHNAICWGVPKDDDGEPYTIVADHMVERFKAQNPGRKVRARKKENFDFSPGERGAFMVDVDGVGPGRPPLNTAEEVAELIRGAMPQLKNVEMLVVPSGSACIKNGETGEELRGITGWRAYFIVENAADIPRLGQILFKSMWLVEEGYIKPASDGKALVRAAVDAMVWQRERLDFVGGANLEAPLVQVRPEPVVFTGKREALDSSLVADLSAAEEAEYAALVDAAKREMRPVLEQKEAEAVEKQVTRRVKPDATEADRERVRAEVRRTLQGETLPPEHLIEVHDKGVWRQVSVAEIVAARDDFHSMETRDPFDPEYDGGRPIGKVFVNPAGVWLKSFAHGERTFGFEGSEPADGAEQIALLGEKLLALYPEKVAAQIVAQAEAKAEAEAREAAGPQIADLDGWTKDGWRELMPPDVDYEARADAWITSKGFDPSSGEGAQKRALVIDGMIGREQLDAMVAHVARRYCHYEGASHEGEAIYDLKEGRSTSYALLSKTLATLEAPLVVVTGSGHIGKSVKNVVDVWMKSDLRKTLSHRDFRPGSTQLFTPGETADTYGVNIYRPRRYKEPALDPAEAGQRFVGFLAHLVPDEREAAFLLNHVIGLVQRPELRGQAVLMVSAKGGAGRGTFFQIVNAMFHPNFTRSLKSDDFVGGAAQWTEWEEHTIFAHVDEMATLGGDKYKAMAELDARIELMPSRKPVTEKGKSRRTVTVYWTFMGAAMSADAIALEKRDRRWTIITNTNVRFGDDPSVAALVSSMQEYPKGPICEGFAHGLNLWLQAQPFDFDMFIDGIETEAKRELLEASEGDIELNLRRVLNDYLKQDKHEVWISNVAVETQSRMRNVERCSEAAVRKAWTKVPELFKQGFDGWEVPTNRGGKPQALRVASSTADGEAELKRAAGSIARHRDAPMYSAEKRRDVLGEKRGR
jgi:hypothetical protein